MDKKKLSGIIAEIATVLFLLLNGLDIHGPGEADGEVLLSYVVMFHKMRLLDLYKTLKK